MRDASSQYEQVPCSVEVPDTIQREKHNTEGVSEPACAEPGQALGADGVH